MGSLPGEAARLLLWGLVLFLFGLVLFLFLRLPCKNSDDLMNWIDIGGQLNPPIRIEIYSKGTLILAVSSLPNLMVAAASVGLRLLILTRALVRSALLGILITALVTVAVVRILRVLHLHSLPLLRASPPDKNNSTGYRTPAQIKTGQS